MIHENPTHFSPVIQKKFLELIYKEERSDDPCLQEEISVNNYLLFHDNFKAEKIYEFEMFGDNGAYKPVFKIKDGKVFSACNCKAGVKDKICWHRAYILSGRKNQVTSTSYSYNMNMMIDDLKSSQSYMIKNDYQYAASSKGAYFKKPSFASFFMFFSSFF